MEEQIIALESKIAFMEDTVEELNRIVYRQQEQMEQLQQQIRLLYQQMQALTPNEKRDLREEIPPHYVTGNYAAFLPTPEDYAKAIAADCRRSVASTVAG